MVGVDSGNAGAKVLLEADNLVFDYDGISALSGASLRVVKGENLALLGPNGSGKSTLFLHLNGTLRAKSGDILLDGKRIGGGRDEVAELRRRVGLVFQNPDDQLFAATVRQDVSFGPLNLGLGEDGARRAVAEAMAALDIGDLADRPTHRLSFGQKKRVVLAGIVAMSPEVLLLDEPTAGLDNRGATEFLAILKRLKDGGATLVMATHDVDFAWGWADTAAILRGGKITAHGPVTKVLSNGFAAEAGLAPPQVLRFHRELASRNLLPADAEPSRRLEDLMRLVDGNM